MIFNWQMMGSSLGKGLSEPSWLASHEQRQDEHWVPGSVFLGYGS